ncbi:MAG: ribonuclease H-like domain-containing protein [Patescibacteria group bacterium]
MNWITFDIETYSPSKSDKINTDELRVSVTGAYISWLDEYVAFMEENTKDFIKLLKEADLIVGWNHIWFDIPVLQKYSDFDLKKLPVYDIMIEMEKTVGNKLKLDNVAKANLGEHKTDSYEQFKHYHWNKEWYKLIDYCMNDVRLTNEIFLKALNELEINYFDLHTLRKTIIAKPTIGEKIEEIYMESFF